MKSIKNVEIPNLKMGNDRNETNRFYNLILICCDGEGGGGI